MVSPVTSGISSQAGCSKLSQITPKNKVREMALRFPWAGQVSHEPDHCTQVREIHVGHEPLGHFTLQAVTILNLSVQRRPHKCSSVLEVSAVLIKILITKSKQ